MNLQQLQYVVATFEEGSFSAAAETRPGFDERPERGPHNTI